MSGTGSQSERLLELKSEVFDLQARISNAETKEEALKTAMAAAQLCLKALSIATDTEKPELKSKANDLINEAERIKYIQSWQPRAKSHVGSIEVGDDQRPRVKQLPEPSSTRQLSKTEKILVLRGSKLNGFTFPPWQGRPSPEEFKLKNGEAAFVDQPELVLSDVQREAFDAWKPVVEALPPPTLYPNSLRDVNDPMRFTQGIDLVQDAATDCSVVASLCAVAARTEAGHPDVLMKKLHPFDELREAPRLSPNGKYIMCLNFNGCYRKVVIDDRLPVTKTSRILHVFDRKNPALTWPALIEKAYLKVRGGYDFPGSNSGTDLWVLTGWIPEQVFLQSDETVPSQLWKRIYNAFNYGDVLITMGTGQMTPRAERELGLAGEHDYAVLDLSESGEQRRLLVKNPWHEGTSWRGNRADSSQNDILEDSTMKQPLVPGTFWMDMESVMQNFEWIYLNWNPGLFKYREDIHFSWDLSQDGANVASRSPPGSFCENPQFSLAVRTGGLVWLLLSRHFKDSDHHQTIRPSTSVPISPGYISLYAFASEGERLYLSDGATEKGPYVDAPQTLLRLADVTPGAKYTIIPSEQELPSAQHSFTLSAFSVSPMELGQAYNKFRCTEKVASAWTRDTAGGNAHAPTYSLNPQFSVHVAHRTAIAIILQTSKSALPIHVKLLHGRGERVYAVTTREIVVDSGDYRRGTAFCQFPNLDAGAYTIVCSTFEAHQEGPFTLRVDSDVPAEVKPIGKEGAGRIRYKLSDGVFAAGVNRLMAPVRPKRLCKVAIVTRSQNQYRPLVPTRSANTLRSNGTASGTATPTVSPLRITIERSGGPERRILIASNGGEYGDPSRGVRTESIDLAPEMLRGGELWLVLDRLTGVGAGQEEWFHTDMFVDIPDGVSVGVFRTADY